MGVSLRLPKQSHKGKTITLLLLSVFACSISPVVVMDTEAQAGQQTKVPQYLQLVLGKATIVDVPVSIKRASLANPEIADVIVLSPRQIYVTGKGYGTTNLTLWGRDEQVLNIFDLEVVIDLSRVQIQLAALMPDEDHIRVFASHDHVTLAGTVSSVAKLSQVLVVAEAYAPKKVINFLRVYPEPAGGNPLGEGAPVTVEVIRGTAVNSQKF